MGQIQYSEKYFDDTFEYRHVVLPPEVAKMLPKNRLLSETIDHLNRQKTNLTQFFKYKEIKMGKRPMVEY